MFKRQITNKSNTSGISAFLAQLVRIQHSLFEHETAEFIAARESALDLINPNWFDWVQFTREIETDLFIKGQKQQRVNRIKNRKIKVVSKKTGETDEVLTNVLKGKWFRDFRQIFMDAKFHGHRLIYFLKDSKGRPVCKFVYPEHVIPQKQVIIKNTSDRDGENYITGPLAPYLISIGDGETLGLYEQLAYAFILRKHSWQSWDQFEELFGVPLRWIKTNATDKHVLDELENFAITMGSANYAIVPGNADMEVKEGNNKDAFQVFNEKRKAVNEEVSIFINGHSEQINEKGSRGKSQIIIEKTQDEITTEDKEDLLAVVNDDLIPMLVRLFGFKFTDDHEVQFDDAKQLEPKDKALIYKQVSDMGFQLNQEGVENNLGVKIDGTKSKNNNSNNQKAANKVYDAYMSMHTKLAQIYNHIKD